MAFWNPPEPYTLNPWTTAGFESVDGVAVAHGHHIWTVTTAMSIGLGIALWRTGRVPARVAAFALPVLSYVLTVAEHASYNAHNSHSSWPAEDAAGFPAVLSGLWSLTGHGRATGVASVVLLVVCLLVDVQRRHHAALLAPAGGDRRRPAGAVNDTEPGARALGWWQARVDRWEGATRRLASLATLLLRAPAQWWADVAVVLAAHARLDGEPRRLAVGRGRAVAVHVRNIRAEAMALTTPGVEPQARAAFRRTAAVVGLVGVTLALWWGMTMAAAIGRSLLLDGDGNYLAGLLENAGQWFNGLSPVQQIAVGAGVAALVALSGGSLALAIGVSGVATYGLSHAEGAATFARDPVRATADYLATTTPLEAALDGGELVLTFLPGNFAGAAAGRGARSLLSTGSRTSVRADPPSGPLAAIDEWIGDVNPGYTGDPFDPRSINCGKCTESVHDVFQGQALTPAGLGTYTVPEMEAITGLRQIEMSPEQIADELRLGGAGSHAVVGIDRADDSGHWFNAYFDGERVVVVDGQSGEILDWPPDFGAVRWDAAIRRMNP
ncbi:hypothetical protein FHR80_002664 [Cellulomonas cellasea]|uniref:Tox-PL domain-containing protein n=2 Tax=Cellulomonas cellasea TaxID=43670 RepID=A0A7W4YC41_9CELL|nr:hypothetical protein [Cellulomonas cellasea]